MAEGVVDLLEVVDVEHHDAHVGTEAPASLDLGVERVVEVVAVVQPGELVGHGLEADGLVQVDVLDRHRGLAGQVGEELVFLVVEGLVRAGDRDHAHLLHRGPAAQPRDQRRGERVDVAGLGSRGAALLGPLVHRPLERGEPVRAAGARIDRERGALGGFERGLELRRRVAHARASHPAGVDREGTARLRLARLDSRSQREVHDALAVKPRGEGVAHAPDRVLELGPLALDLLDLRRQLPRHRVELGAEGGELVGALDRDRLAEVASGEPAGSLEKLRDLALEGANDHHRGQQREQQERREDRADQHAAVANRGAEVRALLEDADADRRAGRLREGGEAAAVLAAGHGDVAGLRVDPAALPDG